MSPKKPRSGRFKRAVLGQENVEFIYPYCPRRITACYMQFRPTPSTAFDRSSTLLLVLTGSVVSEAVGQH